MPRLRGPYTFRVPDEPKSELVPVPKRPSRNYRTAKYNRWVLIPAMLVDLNTLTRDTNKSFTKIAEELNKKYGAQLREHGFDRLTKNMIAGEKHREATRARRKAGLTKARAKVEPVVEEARTPLNFTIHSWYNKELFAGIVIKPRNEVEETEDEY